MTAPVAYTAIRTEGGLLPADLLNRIAAGDTTVGGLTDSNYHLAPGERLGEQITRAWNRLLPAWTRFAAELDALPEGDPAGGATRERWLQPLFHELGQGRLLPTRALTIDGKNYPISHMWGKIPIHLVGARTSLDHRQAGVRGAATASPHSMVQELLNRSDDYMWAIVSNGRHLRLLRDNASLTRQAYLEFDLETIFGNEIYDEFVLLWLVCHESRFDAEEPPNSWLERWVAEAAAAGTRALDALRDQVETAITHLGRGFLAYPDNQLLRKRLRTGDLTTLEYQQQLLRLIYRLIFLLVAEDRALLLDPDASEQAQRHYIEHYSVARLRSIAGGRSSRGPHPDLWRSLTTAMHGLSSTDGCAALGLPSLGSFLWSPDTIPDLDDSDIANSDLLAAIRALTLITDRDARLLRPIDYRNLGADELGGIYEGLLELHPTLDIDTAHFALETVAGSERKGTGSYYTPEPLIAVVLDLSLERLLDEAQDTPDPEAAILALKVLDPAVGSGHFLMASGRRIARRLASVRTGDAEPAPEAVRHALRDVIGRCLYGIDVNPMAVELCKVSLWMEGTEPGRPLSFLDHHIVCGNALLGTTPRLLAKGVPDGAFKAIEGDDRAVAARARTANARERRQLSQGLLPIGRSPFMSNDELATAYQRLDTEHDTTIDDVLHKERSWEQLQSQHWTRLAKLVGDAWCSAFLLPKTPGNPPITTDTIRLLEMDSSPGDNVIQLIADLDGHYRFLHPHLAFPNILIADPNAENGWTGGFDLVTGNPPWDTLSPDQREFFSRYRPGMRSLSPDEQAAVVTELLEDVAVDGAWKQYRRDLVALAQFRAASGRYEIAHSNLGGGATNVYRMFVENALRLTRPGGYVAQVVPAGIYGGSKEVNIRKHLLDKCQLRALYGFSNYKKRWFQVDMARFAVYATAVGGRTRSFVTRFGMEDASELAGTPELVVEADLIRQQEPVTYAIADVRDASAAAAAQHIYGAWPPFGQVVPGLPYREYQREIDMGNDRELFTDDTDGLPVYEGRMIDAFDHRAKTYVSGHGNSAVWTERQFGDPGKAIIPQWYVRRADVPAKVGDRFEHYRIAFMDVASPRDRRSLTAALVPPGVICGHKVPTIAFDEENQWGYMPMLAVMNAITSDWLARNRLTGATMSYTVLDSLPLPRLPHDDERTSVLAPLALRLTATSPEMTPYWNEMSQYGWCSPIDNDVVPPAALVDERSRESVRAQIDAYVAKEVYGLSRAELEFILATFPVLKRFEERKFQEYRTRRLILERFDTL
jgi:hypothetical protein